MMQRVFLNNQSIHPSIMFLLSNGPTSTPGQRETAQHLPTTSETSETSETSDQGQGISCAISQRCKTIHAIALTVGANVGQTVTPHEKIDDEDGHYIVIEDTPIGDHFVAAPRVLRSKVEHSGA